METILSGLWAIRHKPTGILLRQRNNGYGHTQLNVVPEFDWEKNHPIPRLFPTEEAAKLSLREWLKGPLNNHWEDGMYYTSAKVPRIKEDMEVIWIELISDCDQREQPI